MFKVPFGELSIFDKVSTIAFCTILVLFAITAIIALVMAMFNRDKLNDYFKSIRSLFLGAAIAFIAIMFTLKVDEMIAEGSFMPTLFYPILSIFIVVAALAIAGIIINATCKSFMQKFKFIALGITAIPVIVSIVMLALYYKTVAGDYANVSEAGLYVGAVVLVAVIIGLSLVFGKKQPTENATKALSYGAVAIALAFALSYISLFKMPQGGSVTFASLLPIMIYSYMFGTKKGVMIGAIYGIMQAIQDPWIIHPAQFFLDYPIAFAAIGLTGIFKEVGFFKKNVLITFVLGGLVGATLRYLSHAISGIFAFSTYAPAQFNAVAWGFLYNTFVFADIAIAMVAGCLMLSSKSVRKALFNGVVTAE